MKSYSLSIRYGFKSYAYQSDNIRIDKKFIDGREGGTPRDSRNPRGSIDYGKHI